MKQAPFEALHAHEWREFEDFLENPKSKVFPAEEMPARYRRLCQSLALAADRRYSPALVDRLNELALRGHHALYRNRGRQGQRIAEFLLAGFPALVRQEWRLVAAAAALFFGPLFALIAVLQAFPDFVHYLLTPEQIASFHEMYDPASKRLGMREADANVVMFGFYIWNNVRIGFQTFAGGLAFGVVSGYLTEVGYGRTFWSFVAGHSSFELIAIVLSGAAGLRLGLAVIAPGELSRKAALVAAAKPAVRVMYGAAILFLIAAFVEAFWSPHTVIPFAAKIAVGAAGWMLLAAYFGFAGRARAAG